MTTVAEDITYEGTSHLLEGDEPLHYHVAGTGPGLLLLHGSGPGVNGWSNFGGNLGVFGEHFRTVFPDQPGFGKSYMPVIDRAYAEISAAAIVRLLDHLGLDQVHVLGNSMGGRVAAELALAHPDRVGRLVMMGPGGLGVNTLAPAPPEGMKRLFAFNQEPTRERLMEWLTSMVSDPKTLTEDLIDQRFANVQQPGAVEWSQEFFKALNNPAFQGPVPLWARSSHITQPTLLTWGRDDRVVPLENVLMPLRQMPNVELHVFSHCGHWAMIERKEDFERVVLEFLTRPMGVPS